MHVPHPPVFDVPQLQADAYANQPASPTVLPGLRLRCLMHSSGADEGCMSVLRGVAPQSAQTVAGVQSDFPRDLLMSPRSMEKHWQSKLLPLMMSPGLLNVSDTNCLGTLASFDTSTSLAAALTPPSMFKDAAATLASMTPASLSDLTGSCRAGCATPFPDIPLLQINQNAQGHPAPELKSTSVPCNPSPDLLPIQPLQLRTDQDVVIPHRGDPHHGDRTWNLACRFALCSVIQHLGCADCSRNGISYSEILRTPVMAGQVRPG
eukprot:329569-Chlamydomonas_euryale.AAC.2